MQAPRLKRSLKLPSKTQRGIILLLLMTVVLLLGASALITVLSNNQVGFQRDSNTTDVMSSIKDTLISYSVLYVDYYGDASAGPGHLMCPDMDGDGVADEPCAANALGRLPTAITLPSGDIFPLSSYESGLDQQIWYALSDDVRRNPAAALNTSNLGTLTVDGQGSIAAVLIAPDGVLAGQTRVSNASTDYLEAGNVTAPNFVTNDPLSPNNFNDRVLAISLAEFLSPVTARVAEVIRIQLDEYHVISGNFPANQNDFDDVLNAVIPGGKKGGGKKGGGKKGGGGKGATLNAMPAWFISNNWAAVSNYTRISADSGDVSFTACNITYTVNFGVTAMSKSTVFC